MVRTVSSFVDRKCAANQRLGLSKVVCILKQPRQIVKTDGNEWMFGSVELLVYGQRATH